jgi:hypothetical protein
MLAASLSLPAQDPLRPQPVEINREAKPPTEVNGVGAQRAGTPLPADGLQPLTQSPPALGAAGVDGTMAGASIEARAAAEASHRALQDAAPESTMRRYLMVALIACAAGGLLLFAVARWLRQRTL